jgi:hypothetical protein
MLFSLGGPCQRRSCCRLARYLQVSHAADGFRRRAAWYACPCCVLTVTAIKSLKVVRPKRANSVIKPYTQSSRQNSPPSQPIDRAFWRLGSKPFYLTFAKCCSSSSGGDPRHRSARSARPLCRPWYAGHALDGACGGSRPCGQRFASAVPCETYHEAAELAGDLHTGDGVSVSGMRPCTYWTTQDGTTNIRRAVRARVVKGLPPVAVPV